MGYRLFFGRNGLGVTSGVTAGSASRRRGASLALVEPQSPERQPGAPEVDLGPGRRSLGEGPGRAVVRAQHLGRAGCRHLQSVLVRVMAGLFVAGVGNVGARVGKGMPRHKDVATAQEPRKLLARTRKAPPIDGAGEREDVAATRPSCTRA